MARIPVPAISGSMREFRIDFPIQNLYIVTLPYIATGLNNNRVFLNVIPKHQQMLVFHWIKKGLGRAIHGAVSPWQALFRLEIIQ